MATNNGKKNTFIKNNKRETTTTTQNHDTTTKHKNGPRSGVHFAPRAAPPRFHEVVAPQGYHCGGSPFDASVESPSSAFEALLSEALRGLALVRREWLAGHIDATPEDRSRVRRLFGWLRRRAHVVFDPCVESLLAALPPLVALNALHLVEHDQSLTDSIIDAAHDLLITIVRDDLRYGSC